MALRPVITNFLAGELSPRLSGRIDLPIYYQGAKQMRNFSPTPVGGAEKRGGFVYKLNAPVNGSKTRLIPWSIGDGIDLLIAVSDNSIRLIDASSDSTLGYLAAMDGSALNITTLDSEGLIPAYDVLDLDKINYSSDRGEIVLSCKGYPLFYIKFVSISGTSISIEYGTYTFSGVIASNPPNSDDDEELEISSDDVADALRYLTNNTSYAVDAGSYIYIGGVKRYIASVKLNTVANSSRLEIYPVHGGSTPLETLTYTDSSFLSHPIYYYDIKISAIRFMEGGTLWSAKLGPDYKVIASGASFKAAIDEMVKYVPFNGNKFDMMITVPVSGGGTWASGARGRLYWKPSSYTLEIVYYNSGTSGATSTATYNSSAPGDISCMIKIAAQSVSISGARTTGQVIFEHVAPWMVRGKRYLCDESKEFNGAYAVAATKIFNGSEEIIAVEMGGSSQASPTEIRKTTTGLTGRLAVITTPFYDRGDDPEVVCFHQGRLCLAKGNIVYLSKPNEHSDFSFFEEIEYQMTSLKPSSEWADPLIPETRTDTNRTQQVGAGSAMILQIATEENEDIRWLVSAGDLIIGTSTTEWYIPADCDSTNVRLVQASRSGSLAVMARFIGDSVVFASRSGKAVRSFSPATRGMAPDISQYADHILKPGVLSFDFRQDPNQEVFFRLADGTAARLRLTPSQGGSIPAWATVDTLGATGVDEIESIAVLAAASEDAIYASIKRVIAGSTYRFIERLVTVDHEDFTYRSHLDCSSYVASTGTGGTAGNGSLAVIARFGTSEPVSVSFRNASGREWFGSLTFGASAATQYTDSVTLESEYIPPNCEAWVGYYFEARLETFRIDNEETEGIPKGSGPIHARVYQSGPFLTENAHLEQHTFEWPSDSSLNPIIPFTGPINIEYNSEEDIDQSVKIVSKDNNSVNILLIVPEYSVGV